MGISGSGKPTLAKLLVHYYDVTGGAVKIGGQDIREICVEALNDQILVAAQGRIVQKGTHPKLAEQSGLYRDFLTARREAVGSKRGTAKNAAPRFLCAAPNVCGTAFRYSAQ